MSNGSFEDWYITQYGEPQDEIEVAKMNRANESWDAAWEQAIDFVKENHIVTEEEYLEGSLKI